MLVERLMYCVIACWHLASCGQPQTTYLYHLPHLVNHETLSFQANSYYNLFLPKLDFSFYTSCTVYFNLIDKSMLKVAQKSNQHELEVTIRELTSLLQLFYNYASTDKSDIKSRVLWFVCTLDDQWLQSHDYMTVIIMPFRCMRPKW